MTPARVAVPELTAAAQAMLEGRYLRRDPDGHVTGTAGDLFDEVGTFVAAVEDRHEPGAGGRWARRLSDVMRGLELLHQAGAGTGFAFGHLRPAGDRVDSTGGSAGGPMSFMRLLDTAVDVVGQSGRRRGVEDGPLPESVSVRVVREVFLTAWRAGAKGITVFRAASVDDVDQRSRDDHVACTSCT